MALFNGRHVNSHRNQASFNQESTKYLTELQSMGDAQLKEECKDKIWLSAYAQSNPRSDYHWMCDFCYAECSRRSKPEIYSQAHKYVVENN